MSNANQKEIILYGIGGSPGICIGKAYLVDKEGIDVVPKYGLRKKKISSEIKRFKTAVKNATDELRRIISEDKANSRESVHILEAHLVLLKDKMIYNRTIEVIEKDLINAEWAVMRVVTGLKSMFEGMDDDYLRDRGSDILHVTERIMTHLTGSDVVNISDIDKRVILVARDLSPAETSQIQLERVMGFVTDFGASTSHTGIIARSLEIPAVLGLENGYSQIKNNDIIIVDGGAGVVVINPKEQTLIEAEELKANYEARRAAYTRRGHLPSKTKDGCDLPIMGNIELPEEVVAVLDKGGDGIGLYRTEFQYLSRRDFPSEDELFENYKSVIEVMPEKPVTIRTLDINGDKALNHINVLDEANPALGMRAIRYCLEKTDVFKTQLRAIYRAAKFGRVRLLLPMISRVQEVIETKTIIGEVVNSLKKDGLPFQKDIQIGVMIEVPSAALTADQIAKQVDFFSIGTNDLIQYTMAMDRGNQHVAYLYNPLNPAVLSLIKNATDAAHKNNIPVFMCGEMASEPLYTPVLLGLGLDELSANPQAIPVIKNAVRTLDAKQARLAVEQIMTLTSEQEIEALLLSNFGDLFNNNLNRSWRR